MTDANSTPEQDEQQTEEQTEDGGIPLLDGDRMAELLELCEKATPGPWDSTHSLGGSDEDVAFIIAARTALPEALATIEYQWNELQAADSHAQSILKALRRAEWEVERLEAEADERAAYSAMFWRRDELTGALVNALASPYVRARIESTKLKVIVGNGDHPTSRINVSQWQKFEDIACVNYLLEPGGGYRVGSEICDDTDRARELLKQCHDLALAIIDDGLVTGLILDEEGVMRVGDPVGAAALVPKDPAPRGRARP